MVNTITKSKGHILLLDCCSLSDLLGDTLKLDNEEFHSDGESPVCRQALEHQHRERIMQYVPHVETGVCSTASCIGVWYQTSWEICAEHGHSSTFILLLHRDFYSVNANCLEDLDAVGRIILISVLAELGWEVVECINVTQIRDRWQALANTGMKVWVAQNGNFLTDYGTTSFWRTAWWSLVGRLVGLVVVGLFSLWTQMISDRTPENSVLNVSVQILDSTLCFVHILAV
jgi:hypothetical protein